MPFNSWSNELPVHRVDVNRSAHAVWLFAEGHEHETKWAVHDFSAFLAPFPITFPVKTVQ
jgi:hypothetical protein